MSRLVSIARIFGTFLYAMFCGMAIFLLSGNQNEWMAGDHDADGTAVTLCSIPSATDNLSDVGRPLTLAMVALLLAFGGVRLLSRRKGVSPLVLGLGLLLLWAYRFWGPTFFCTG